jgi:hypothetical protein
MRRRVAIQDGPPRDSHFSHAAPVVSRRTNPSPCVPTGDIRHIGVVRDGPISFEVFSKANLEKIPVDPDIVREREKGKKTTVVKDAAEQFAAGLAAPKPEPKKRKAKPKNEKPVTKKKKYVKRRVKK